MSEGFLFRVSLITLTNYHVDLLPELWKHIARRKYSSWPCQVSLYQVLSCTMLEFIKVSRWARQGCPHICRPKFHPPMSRLGTLDWYQGAQEQHPYVEHITYSNSIHAVHSKLIFSGTHVWNDPSIESWIVSMPACAKNPSPRHVSQATAKALIPE